MGVTGVCIDTRGKEGIENAAIRAHAEGLEYHAWVPSMLRKDLPHEWYVVNRLGQSADDNPNYLNDYRFLDPANPEVQEYLFNQYVLVAKIPEVDYVRLDFMRYPDVIRTALYNYLYAKQKGGDFIIRIEDTDSHRFVPGAEQYIIEALNWCGIIPDEGVDENGKVVEG